MMKHQFLIVLLIFFILPSVAQEFMVIEGKLIDATTKQPLQFGNIGIKGNKYGTISNQNGEFVLKFPNNITEKIICFSYLGYKNKEFKIENENFLLVELEVLPVVLGTITIKYKKPEEILLEALHKIPENYMNKPSGLKAFYREKITENQEYIQFIEAVLEIYKSAYSDTKDKDRVRIIKGMEQTGLKKSVFFNYLYFVNGPYEALHQDVAKYGNNFIEILQSSISFLNPRHFKFYEYQFTEIQHDGAGNHVYDIAFKPNGKKAMLEGHILIEKENLAILAVEYKIYKPHLKNAQLIRADSELYIRRAGFYTRSIDYNCNVVFKKYEGKYLFSNSRVDYRFFFIDNANRDSLLIANTIDLVVTSIDTENVSPFKLKESIWKEVSLDKQLGDYDPDFWENYNTIKKELINEADK